MTLFKRRSLAAWLTAALLAMPLQAATQSIGSRSWLLSASLCPAT